LHKDPSTIPVAKAEATDEGRKKLKKFHKKVSTKTFKHWTNPSDLGSVVSRSLINLIKKVPAVGWIRANATTAEDAVEILGLRKQIDELEKRLESLPPVGAETLAQGADLFKLRIDYRGFGREGSLLSSVHSNVELSWNEIFNALAPFMLDRISEDDLHTHFSHFVREREEQRLCKTYNFTKLFELRVSITSFNAIKVQLRSLGLIETHGKTWLLTPYGDAQMMQSLAIKRATV